MTTIHRSSHSLAIGRTAGVDPERSYMGGLDARGSFTAAATKDRHFDGLVPTMSGYPCSLAGTQEFWLGPGWA
jgi:hypothetical protein